MVPVQGKAGGVFAEAQAETGGVVAERRDT